MVNVVVLEDGLDEFLIPVFLYRVLCDGGVPGGVYMGGGGVSQSEAFREADMLR